MPRAARARRREPTAASRVAAARVVWLVGLELGRSELELERSERLGADAVRVAALM
jgi:hypothetical protein